MKELEPYYVIELSFALRDYIEKCDAKGMWCTAKELRELRERISHSRVYLEPFNT